MDNLFEFTPDEWVDAFDDVYREANIGRSLESRMLHVVEHASEIHEDMRIARYYEAVNHLADCFCWTCALVTKAREDYKLEPLSQLVLNKYPRICYHCGYEKCICSATRGPAIEDLETKAQIKAEAIERNLAKLDSLRESDNLPKSLVDFEGMFSAIYSHVNFATPLEQIVAHFQEEVGEVAECVNNLVDGRNKRKEWRHELEMEIADIFTWSTALLKKLDYVLGASQKYNELASAKDDNERRSIRRAPPTGGLTIPIMLWNRYGSSIAGDRIILECPRCHERKCDGSC